MRGAEPEMQLLEGEQFMGDHPHRKVIPAYFILGSCKRLDGRQISVCAGDTGDLPSTESVCGDDSLNVWVGHILRHPGSNAGHGLLKSRSPPGVRANRNMATRFLTDQAARAVPIAAVLM